MAVRPMITSPLVLEPVRARSVVVMAVVVGVRPCGVCRVAIVVVDASILVRVGGVTSSPVVVDVVDPGSVGGVTTRPGGEVDRVEGVVGVGAEGAGPVVAGAVVVTGAVVVGLVVVVVVVTGGQVGLVTVFESSVTAPLLASSRPATVAPVVAVIEIWLRMVPAKTEFVPRVAELPICQ